MSNSKKDYLEVTLNGLFVNLVQSKDDQRRFQLIMLVDKNCENVLKNLEKKAKASRLIPDNAIYSTPYKSLTEGYGKEILSNFVYKLSTICTLSWVNFINVEGKAIKVAEIKSGDNIIATFKFAYTEGDKTDYLNLYPIDICRVSKSNYDLKHVSKFGTVNEISKGMKEALKMFKSAPQPDMSPIDGDEDDEDIDWGKDDNDDLKL